MRPTPCSSSTCLAASSCTNNQPQHPVSLANKSPRDKKTATTFQLLHRSQNDPLIHDNEASQFVFSEVPQPNTTKSISYPTSSAASVTSDASFRRRANATGFDLASEFGGNARANEGEAAEYGIYYDDTEYDYMQHMRDLGNGAGETVWVEAPGAKKSGKQKQSLEDALREATLDDGRSQGGSLASGLSMSSHAASDVFHDSMLPSEFVQPNTYQNQQDVPDAIAGFQPDMDPRLREVLEALEDEAYVDEKEDGDFFEELTGEGGAEGGLWDDDDYPPDLAAVEDDPGWETDDTIKPDKEHSSPTSTAPAPTVGTPPTDSNGVILPAPDAAPADREDTGWQAEFDKFKASGKAPKAARQDALPADMQSGSIMTGASSLLTSGRRKKRKGAQTSTSGYSMSSSILSRTEHQSVLDAKFDVIEEEYSEDYIPDGGSMISGMTGMSRMSKMSSISTASSAAVTSPAFGALVDDFLGHNEKTKTGHVKKGQKKLTGMQNLDEVRQGLGPARLKT